MKLTPLLNGLLLAGSYSWSLELLLNKLNYTENLLQPIYKKINIGLYEKV